MEKPARSSMNETDALSQSYIQGVERVAQQSNVDTGFNFKLPTAVIQEREKAWSGLFDKYADEVSSEVELNIRTMKPANDEGSEEDDEHSEYYTKCRAPIRKLPALIQYWVDTGNPPYQITGEEDHSETGSSLSEGEYSRSRQSAALRESIENPKVNEASPYSSVDTAAYVLSNANVTKKAQTQEIVEGAKRSDEQAGVPSEAKIADVSATVDGTAPVNNSVPNNASILNQSQGSSVMLCEVLPALQQFDDLLEKSKQLKPPRSALSKVRRIRKSTPVEKSKIVEAARDTQKNSLDSSENSLRKTTNLRKLYTGRNSPIDLIMARTSTESSTPTRPMFHPALVPEENSKSQVSSFISRARARKKRKRATLQKSTIAQLNNSQESQESVPGDGNNNNPQGKKSNEIKEGHERYTDFFESLGLTPSKTIIGKDDENGSESSARRKITMENEEIENPQVNDEDSAEISMKESQDSFSQNCSSKTTAVGSELLGNKILKVRLERLSDDCLFRYRQAKSHSTQCNQSGKNLNIELLTTMTQDSDSSTILICSCNPTTNDQSSESDCSLSTQSVDRRASESFSENDKSQSKNASNDESPELPIEICEESKRISPSNEFPKSLDIPRKFIETRDVVVKLERLPINQLLNVSKRSSNTPSKKLRVSPRKTLQFSSPATSDVCVSPEPLETGTTCVTIGSRVFGKTSQFGESNLKRTKRGSSDRNFEMCLEDDDDDFVKLLQSFGSNQRGIWKPKKEVQDNEQKMTNGKSNGTLIVPAEKIPKILARSRCVVETSSSDDHENDVTEIRSSKGRSKQTKIVRKSARNLTNGTKKDNEDAKDSTNRNESLESKNSPKKLAKLGDKADKNPLNELENARTPNSRKKRQRVPPIETNREKRSRLTRSARFQTLLHSDTDSSDNQNVAIKNQRRSRINWPLNPMMVSPTEIPADSKKTDESSDSKKSGKKSSRNLEDSISESAVSIKLQLHDSTKDSREELKILDSPRKKKEDSRRTAIAKRNWRRTKILGTPIESDSEDDDRRQLRKNSNDNFESCDDGRADEKKSSSHTKIDKNVNRREKRSRRSQNLFSNIFDDTTEDVDSLFSGNGDSEATKNERNTRNSNRRETLKISKKQLNARESTITFRTRLNSFSDDENVL